MYTQHGQQQRRNLLNLIDEDKVLNALRPIVEQVPAVVTQRVRGTGSGSGGRFSAYSNDWAKKRSRKGLQTGNKDFWFDGTMWGSYKIVGERIGDGFIQYELGTTGGKSRSGSEYLSDIHSDNENQFILDITDEEWEKLQDRMWEEILKTMNV